MESSATVTPCHLPGNRAFGIQNTPKVVSGCTEACAKRCSELYERFVGTVVPARGTREAELSKLLENTYRSVNIALVNEFAYDFLVSEPGCTSEMLIDRFGRDLLKEAQLALFTGSMSALLRLAGHGHGVTLLPEMAVARELESGELVELGLAQSIRPVSIVAQWHPRLGPAEHALHALLDVARRADPLPELRAQ